MLLDLALFGGLAALIRFVFLKRPAPISFTIGAVVLVCFGGYAVLSAQDFDTNAAVSIASFNSLMVFWILRYGASDDKQEAQVQAN